MFRKALRALAVAWLTVAISCLSARAVLTPEYGVDAVIQNDAGFAVSSSRGKGRFQVEAVDGGRVVVRLRYALGRPIAVLAGLEVVEGPTDLAIVDDRVRFETGTLTLEMDAGEIWRIRFSDVPR